MQIGEYIKDRLLPDMVHDACKRQGIVYEAFSDDWVLRLSGKDAEHWVFGYKFDLNSSAASSLAQDKVAAYQILSAAGIPAMPHLLARSVASEAVNNLEIAESFDAQPVVIKPLAGTGGRGVLLQKDVEQAVDFIKHSLEPAWAISPYQEIIAEFRCIVLDNEVTLAYEKTQPVVRDDLRFFNLGMGARAQDISSTELLDSLKSMAITATKSVGLRLAAVDLIRTKDGELKILEMNDGIMMENYARQSAEYKNRAANVYDAIVAAMLT